MPRLLRVTWPTPRETYSRLDRRRARLLASNSGVHTGGIMLTRRNFLKLTGASTIGWYVATQAGWMERAVAQIPGGTLNPGDVPKFQTAMLIPPVMPRAGTITMPGGKPADYYEISMRQLSQQILPAGMPATTVWGYGAVKSASSRGLLLHHAPSLTIETMWKRPVRIKWINELVDAGGNYRPHLLPVDPTLHWANPPGGTAGRDMRLTFTSTPGPYTGPVPIVTHLHGAAGVGDESDGYAEAWYLPDAGNIPAGYATEGTWYDFFAAKAASKFGVTGGPGFAIFQYPNDQRESTLWYHDHALGMTRLNVYAGPAGFYLVRGGPEGDKAIRDSRSGTTAVLPGPAPNEGDMFPPNKTYYEIPIAVQDRSFDADTRAFFDGITGPYIPDTDVSPIWNPEFFGNMIMANGNTWPFQRVEQRRYRLRFLNGCQSRFLILDFSNIPGVEVWQIGNEGGFLAAPVDLTADNGNRLLMGLAERADLIVDFTGVPVGNHVLRNVGPDEPVEARLATVEGAPNTAPAAAEARLWMDPVTENPAVGATEVWEYYNATADAHPMHIHEVTFQVVNRQAIVVNETDGTVQVQVDAASAPTPPERWENGWKDTVVAYPGQVTRLRLRFTNAGQFVWHCHIVEHEDNEMMRPYRIGPPQPGQPASSLRVQPAAASKVRLSLGCTAAGSGRRASKA